MVTTTLPALSEDSLAAYLNRVYSIPLLTQEEEYDLAARLQENGDLHAAQRLVLSHLRYVVRVARDYKGYGLPLADLIQEGSVGLMKAVKRFDPTVGVRLVSFAVHWIKSEIHEYVLRNWRIVKIATTKAQRKLFFNLRRQKQRLGWFSEKEIATVAQDLGVTTKDVMEMEMRLNAHDSSFDMPTTSMDSKTDLVAVAPENYLIAEQSQQGNDLLAQLEYQDWQDKKNNGMARALATLDNRAKEIIESRWLVESEDAITLKILSEKFGISVERVRQLEKAALQKLRLALT
jgi:RNA polymerase sigma-32 factor